MLALILEGDSRRAEEGLRRLRSAFEALEGCLQDGRPTTKFMANRCALNGLLYKWIKFYGSKTHWVGIAPQIKSLAETIFDGFMQSRINEHCNQKLRDHETRDNSSRHMKHMRICIERPRVGCNRDRGEGS